MLLQKPSSFIAREQRTPGPRLRHLDWIVTLLVVAKCAWLFAAPLRSPGLPLRYAQDDFFYYLKTAQNLAWLHRSTFDGQTLTNGYHPLYFGLITVVSLLGVHTAGIFRALWLIDTASATAIFLTTRRLFARTSTQLLANVFALAITLLCLPILCDQMEVTLALPLGFAFLLTGFCRAEAFTRSRSAGLGLLAAFTFLARLDAAILVALFFAAALCTREYRTAFTRRNVLSFAVGFLPLPVLYLGLNQHYFHTLLPISGMAKELRHGWKLSPLLPVSFSGTSELLLYVAVLAAIASWALRKRLSVQEKVFLFAALGTPFLFYGLEMLTSDWPIWNWYFYDLRFSAAGAAFLLATALSRDRLFSSRSFAGSLVFTQPVALLLAAAVLLVFLRVKYKVDDVMIEIQHAAVVLDDFAVHHPGKYAMGDRAGMFAITTASPVLQTEGLMSDRGYLEHIRAQDDLRSVLAGYGVNYYVAFIQKKNKIWQHDHACFHAMEPSIAGPDALRMRSDFCEAPAFQFPGDDGDYLIYRINPA